MTATISAWLILTLCLGLLASLAIWSRRPTQARGLAVASFLAASPLAAVALAMALGWPIPYWPGITVPEGKHTLLGHKLVEGEGIFVLLDIGSGVPRYYRLPWSTETAESLQGAEEQGGEEGEVGLKVPAFEWSWDEHEFQFWAEPQAKLPEKYRPQAAPHFNGDA